MNLDGLSRIKLDSLLADMEEDATLIERRAIYTNQRVPDSSKIAVLELSKSDGLDVGDLQQAMDYLDKLTPYMIKYAQAFSDAQDRSIEHFIAWAQERWPAQKTG